MTLYVSLFLILVAFFVVLMANAIFDDEKAVQAIGSIKGGFGVLPGGSKLDKGTELLFPSPSIVDKDRETEESLKQYMQRLSKKGRSELIESLAQIASALKKTAAPGIVKVTMFKDNVVITILDYAIFRNGTDNILPQAKPLLSELAHIIRYIPYSVIISGHTDDRPMRGKKFYNNWVLSATRAIRIVRYLVENEGITPEKLRAEGYSQYRPRFPNDSPDNRRLNRRVEVSFEL